jgi:hypothetical protein
MTTQTTQQPRKRLTNATLVQQLRKAEENIQSLQEQLKNAQKDYTALGRENADLRTMTIVFEDVLVRIAKFFQIAPFDYPGDDSERFVTEIMNIVFERDRRIEEDAEIHDQEELTLRAQISVWEKIIPNIVIEIAKRQSLTGA